jgi:tRNA (cmo5U34)-methyltransferase
VAVPGRFGADEAPGYDSRMAQFVPGYALLHRLVLAELSAALPAEAQVLVVGAGTGAELELLATARSGWRFVAVDPAGPMLDVARAKADAGGYGERVGWHRGYVAELEPHPRYDGAVMVLVSHFLPMDGAKQALLAEVAARLRPGAPLVFADLAQPASPDSPQAAVRRLAAIDRGVEPAAAEAMVRNMWQTLHPVDGPELDALLADAGMGPARSFFQALGYRGWVSARRGNG